MPELHWQGKGDAVKAAENVPRRVLKLDSSLSYGAADSQNMILQGDNLDVLKAMLPYFRSAVKCIYIDPPYNTHAVFEHYVDNFPHGDWLSMMYPRLELLRDFLADDGSIFVQIDNGEQAYLKVLMDEIFGRENFVNDIIWKRRGGSANPSNRLNNVTDYILWYTRSQNYEINFVYSKDDENTKKYIEERFTNELNGKKYMLAPVERNAKLGLRENLRYEYKGYIPKYGWMMSQKNLEQLDNEHRLHWNSKGRPNRRVFLDEYKGQPINNLWTDVFVINPMSGERVDFDGQKPESLIQRILQLATQEGDLVLDAFLGSGTTAAVAHKMNRRYIGIELGDHAITHVVPRLCNVVDGEQGGISKAVNWQGGGGFKFYRLGEKLFNEVGAINPAIEFKDLAAYVWFTETNTAYSAQAESAFLGVHNGAAIYLLTEPLTHTRFEKLTPYEGEKIIYATACRLGETFLRENKVMYKELK